MNKMSKIKSLTEEQEAMLPFYRDKWLKIGLSTEPCDRAKAEDAAARAYKAAALKPPGHFIWCDSPLSMVIVDAILQDARVRDSVGDSVRASVGDSVRASVGDSVRASVRASVRDSVWDSVRDSVGNSVRASVGDSVRASVGDSVWDSVRDSVWDSVRASVGDSVRASVYGAHDAHWLGFYDFFREVLGLDCCNKLSGLIDLASSCGWWIPRENVCLLSEKPIECNLLDGVIHNDSGPAVAYRDGFAVWAIEGVRVDEQIVMQPETQTLDQVSEEDNEEVKRIRISRYGWQRYLEGIGATVVDVSVGRWAESLMRTAGGMTILCTYDPSTGRPYSLEVNPNCKTCEEAQRYLLSPHEAFGRAGVNVDQIKTYPLVRT